MCLKFKDKCHLPKEAASDHTIQTQCHCRHPLFILFYSTRHVLSHQSEAVSAPSCYHSRAWHTASTGWMNGKLDVILNRHDRVGESSTLVGGITEDWEEESGKSQRKHYPKNNFNTICKSTLGYIPKDANQIFIPQDPEF